MPTAVPPIGFSATLNCNDGASNAIQAFLFPVHFSVPSGTVNKVDISYLGQATKDRLFVPGMIDNGEFEFEFLYCEADLKRLAALKLSAIVKSWVLTAPDDGTGTPTIFTFSGFVVKYPTKFEMEAIPHVACSVQITGPITVT
jgi:hypothetical protein